MFTERNQNKPCCQLKTLYLRIAIQTELNVNRLRGFHLTEQTHTPTHTHSPARIKWQCVGPVWPGSGYVGPVWPGSGCVGPVWSGSGCVGPVWSSSGCVSMDTVSLSVCVSPGGDPVFWWLPVSGRGDVVLHQETVTVPILLLLVFTHNPPLVEHRGPPRPPTHKETTLQTKHRNLVCPTQQQEVETVDRLK